MKAKYSFFLLFLCTWTPVLIYAQTAYLVDQVPQGLRSRANAIIREQRQMVQINAADDVTLSVKEAITIFNEAGDDHGGLALFYDKNTTIKTIKGLVYNAFGIVIGKIGEKDFRDESAVSSFSLYEDDRVKHFKPSILQYPYTVVYEYELKSKQNLAIADWIPNRGRDVAVESASYELICSPADEIRIKECNYPGKREKYADGKWKHYKWSVNNIKAEKIEPYALPAESYQVQVKVAPVNFSFYKKTGSYHNWEELGKWIYDELVKSRQSLSPEVVSRVKTMTDTIKDERGKIKFLYRYLQKKTRYVSVQIGVGGNQPIAAMEVDRLGYGDCKGLANYMQSLLSTVGIPSYYCVVYGDPVKRNLEADFASMNQGNHVILAVPLQQDTVWLECTDQSSPFGFLGSFTDDRIVLACTPDGGKLLHTPKLSADQNLQIRKGSFLLNKDGLILGKIQTTFEGAQYDNHLGLKELSSQEQAKKMKEVYNIDQIDFDRIHFETQLDTPYKISEEIDVHISRYAVWNDKRLYLLPNLFNKKAAAPDLQKRISPFYFVRGYTDEDEIVFELPADYAVEIKPKNIRLITEFGNFEATIKEENSQLVYYRKLVMYEGTYKPEQYTEYASFVKAIRNSDYGKIILKEKE